ncbi:ribonuclease T2 [Cognatishimia sp. MH4019]|uniref:ribonuclease T2 family protein n=1 Tax=Cognatishimia sp. MH4019 TaxID=2854030 RepID=UPI001CD295DE|nr:ribonuclease T2 [Cognatishimia sp. MH4019]
MRFALILVLLAGMARADGERAGVFDYYVMALSWSPTWCALEGDARGSDQCAARHDHGWTLHGLWPQFHRGWPSYCRTAQRSPSRGQTGAMADIMGSGGLAWHQWKKHGVCSGLSAEAYYELSRDAYGSIARPSVFRKLENAVKVPASVVEEAFLEVNPALEPDMITITCRQGRIQEARICLSKDLTPVPCGQDVIRDCQMSDALLDPVR